MALNYQAAVNISAEFTGQGAVDNAKRSFASLNGTVNGTASGLSGLANSFKALAAALAVRELAQYAKGIIDVADQLNDLHTTTGLSVEVLDSLKGAAEDNGVGFEELTGSLKKFTANLALNQKDFISIGVTSKDSSTALLQLADRFNSLPGPQEKAALALKAFGKSGVDMVRVLGDGSEALKDFGSGITSDFAARADQFNDRLGSIKRQMTALTVESLTHLLPALQEIGNAFLKLGQQQTGNGTVFDYLADGIRIASTAFVAFFEAVANGIDTIITSFKALGSYAAQFGAASSNLFRNNAAGKSIQESGESDREQLLRGLLERSEARKKAVLDFGGTALKNLGNPAGSAADTAPSQKKSKTGTADLGQIGEQAKKDKTALENIREEQAKQIELNSLEQKRLSLSTAEYDKQKIAIDDWYKAKKEANTLSPEAAKLYEQESVALTKLKQAAIDYNEQQKKSFGAGAKAAFKEYAEAAADTAAQTKHLFSTALNGLEDAIVSFVKTGKLSFADLANSIETELIHIAVRKSIAFAIGSAFASGGIMTGQGPIALKKYASGGVASSPQLAMFGEGSTPEAYVPLPDGRSIPVTMRGANGGGGQTNVEVNVNIVGNSADNNQTSTDTDKGKQIGNMISTIITQRLIEEQRPGGLLA